MTIPWMMNCGHADSGWCTACVSQLGEKRVKLLAACKQMLEAVEGSYSQVRVAIGVMKQAVTKAEEVTA